MFSFKCLIMNFRISFTVWFELEKSEKNQENFSKKSGKYQLNFGKKSEKI